MSRTAKLFAANAIAAAGLCSAALALSPGAAAEPAAPPAVPSGLPNNAITVRPRPNSVRFPRVPLDRGSHRSCRSLLQIIRKSKKAESQGPLNGITP